MLQEQEQQNLQRAFTYPAHKVSFTLPYTRNDDAYLSVPWCDLLWQQNQSILIPLISTVTVNLKHSHYNQQNREKKQDVLEILHGHDW